MRADWRQVFQGLVSVRILERRHGACIYAVLHESKQKSPSEMWAVLCEHGHFSIGYTVSLSFLLAGFSCGVENELNSQRDIVHLARITVARTAAQKQPPLVVQHPALLPIIMNIRDTALRGLAEASSLRGLTKKADWHEAANLLWPAAKAQCAVVTGSLRGFQKLVSAISDEGKEAEYRNLLLLINENLHALLPEMFRANDEFEYKPPHFQGD